MSARRVGTAIAGLVIAAASQAHARPLPPRGAFVYSNLCIEPQSGDWAGHRLVLVLLDGDIIAHYEWSEGGLEGAAAVTSRFDHPSEALQFSFQTDDGKTQTVRGIVGTDKFLLTQGIDWESGGLPIAVPRQYDLDAKVPACKSLPLRRK